jgi:diguanylate cyclase (GGDEF)-like protein
MMERIQALLVTDDNDNILAIDQLLRSEGCTVYHAENGKDALKQLSSRSFRVVVTEMHSGDVGGIAITQAALNRDPEACVIVMTTTTFLQEAVDAMEAGAFCYVSKPIILKEVLFAVRRAMRWIVLRQSGKQQEQLAEMSVKDALTGLYNRRFMQIFVAKKIMEGSVKNEKFALIMIDLDHFKNFNDTQGHQAGDALLRDAGKLYMESIGEKDRAFRYGGEEFAIFCGGVDKDGGRLFAERLRNLVSLYLPATASMGVAEFPSDGQTIDALIARADAALYHSKESGRNRVTVASADLGMTAQKTGH